jgi:5'(3')-deoxyribonucleotidase
MNRVAIDIDEVLVNFLFPMAKRNHKTHKLRSKPKYNYVYREIFEIDEVTSQKMVQEFYQSKAFMGLKPIPGSQKAMYKLRRGANKMYVVTGRQDSVREETEAWIETYFPNIFDDVILTNSYTPHEVKKSDICRALNIGLIIDDNKSICDQCIEAGTDALNYIGDDEIYSWCEESEISIKGWDTLKL